MRAWLVAFGIATMMIMGTASPAWAAPDAVDAILDRIAEARKARWTAYHRAQAERELRLRAVEEGEYLRWRLSAPPPIPAAQRVIEPSQGRDRAPDVPG